ncbi:hypothetical protein ACIO6T_41485 [Streptomyces sp. NPDC087532]|uniref:hypothetical protein n=1 Tax=unclassified Streptomyces TaxID=2593676 RepID=UPI003423B0D7
MTAQTKRPPSPDAAYRTWIDHTTACATCRAGALCLTAVRLGRVWRKTRRR